MTVGMGLPSSAFANSAIGIYSGANLATLAEPSFDVLIYAFERLHCALRRYHSL